MIYGLKFTNNSDVVILDSEFSRLVVLYSARYSGNANFPTPITSQEPPLVFVRPDANATFQWVRILGSPGNWTGWANTYPVNVNGEYFVAAYASKETATYGMRLWDGGAKLLFDNGTPCAQFSVVVSAWTFLGSVNNSPGRWTSTWVSAAPLSSGDFMLINNIALDLPGSTSFSKLLVSWDYSTNRVSVVLQNIGDFDGNSLFLPVFFAKRVT